MKTIILMCGLIVITANASDLQDAYDDGKAHAEIHNNDAFNAINTTSLSDTIPYYQEATPDEVNLAIEIADDEKAKEYALSDPQTNALYHEALNINQSLPPISESTIDAAASITANPEKYVDGDPFCLSSECNDLVNEPNQEIASTAVLEDVLGGGSNYSETAMLIYTGKKEKCKKGSFFGINMKDCCDDDGWLLELHLSSCPEVEDLIQKKADGKCHYIGDYSESTMFGKDEYKSYCCYTSKMARATEEGAEKQIGKTFGKPKKPNCRGLTPDEFASLDFTKIDLDDVYGDMEQNLVTPDPNEMQSTPDSYYSSVGVNP